MILLKLETDPKPSIKKERNIGVQWILELHGWLNLIAKMRRAAYLYLKDVPLMRRVRVSICSFKEHQTVDQTIIRGAYMISTLI
jgi:hypothetical protein